MDTATLEAKLENWKEKLLMHIGRDMRQAPII